MYRFATLFIACFLTTAAETTACGLHGKHRTTIATPQEDDYDVQYVKLDLQATNLSTAISGSARTVARVVVPAMNDFYFELSNQLTIDSAKVNGQILPVSQQGAFVNKISLPAALPQNTVFTVDVYYHGAPTGGTGFFTNGILNQTDASVPVQVTHTVSAAIHSRDWWPCKQSLTDKIDSADIWVTVPAGVRVAGNGLLQQVTNISPGFERYEWSTRYPVDYYLLSFAAAPYTEYNYMMHFTGSSDSMLIQNYIYNDPGVLAQHQDELDSIAHIVNYFSDLFGRYPYDKEKFGICMTPLGGGMENQTMVSLGSLDISLIAHELAHQWWGNHVTCQSLADMWLNEGWATYCEQLFMEHFRSPAIMPSYRAFIHNQVKFTTGGSVYVDDTTQEGRIYSGRLTYYKGAAVAHMLRYMINDDSVFFDVLRTYHQQYGFGTATTEDLKGVSEQLSGKDLDTFFQQWVYSEGFPTYSAKWAQQDSQIVIRITQATSKPASVPTFKLPIEIQLQSAAGDTLIRVMNDHNIQYYTFHWDKAMTGMTIDPQHHIIKKLGPMTADTTILHVESPAGHGLRIYPNPSSTGWHLRDIPASASLYLADAQGRTVWHRGAGGREAYISARGLAAGLYLLRVTEAGRSFSYNLIRP